MLRGFWLFTVSCLALFAGTMVFAGTVEGSEDLYSDDDSALVSDDDGQLDFVSADDKDGKKAKKKGKKGKGKKGKGKKGKGKKKKTTEEVDFNNLATLPTYASLDTIGSRRLDTMAATVIRGRYSFPG